MPKNNRQDGKGKVDASNDRPRIEPSPHDQKWKPNVNWKPDVEPRKRDFDVDGIIDKSSQARLDGSLEFERIAEALGTRDPDFVWGITAQIIDALADHHYGDAIGFVLSVIKNQRPRDHMERMLVTQGAVAYLKAMGFAEELSPGGMDDEARPEFALKATIGFNRVFASSLSVLKQYRSGGEQRVTVRHVSVSDGAQAIVGNVNSQRVIEESPAASPMLTDARGAAMEPIATRDPLRVRSERSDER